MTTDQIIINKPARQSFVGIVVSNKMKDTVVVSVKRYRKHSKYEKFLIKKTKFMAHDLGNTKKIGDTVTIEACRPISKRKFFRVIS